MNNSMFRVVAGCMTLALLSGCARSTEGTAADAGSSEPAQTSTSLKPSTTAAATPTSTEEMNSLPAYGVVETTKRPVTAGETVCEPETAPANTVEARSAAAGSPTVIIGVPDGFAPGAQPEGDVALNLTGPDGMTGTVTIAPTTLDATDAFRQYADDRTADYEITSVSLLPSELCDYSGQELMGILADQPGQGIDYADRIVHVWTDNGDFLIAVRLQAPNGGPSLDSAKSVMLSDFGIRMP